MKPSLFVSAILFSTGALAACGGANNAKLSGPVFADMDGDSDLDLAMAHWGAARVCTGRDKNALA